ncbi:hypothetical protein ACP26L_16135 [Paenibacillus sp. S-38]|uniref:hypothetical protein n=1 Tax=Paenibacillus sp. S-38 TaxID=3416710 RepID=UPI003CFA8F6C
MRGKRAGIYGSLIGMTCLIAAFLMWLAVTEPLQSTGLDTVEHREEGYTEYVIGLENAGVGAIELLSVTVNGTEAPDLAQLGISYDSAHLVQVMPEPEPAIRFMELNAAPINPKLTPEQMREALELKFNTPISYGLRLRLDEAPITRVTVRYRYLGFSKTAVITRWFP